MFHSHDYYAQQVLFKYHSRLSHCYTSIIGGILLSVVTEMQVKLDHEKMCRKQAEDAKFEMEKKKNELLVDLDQIRSQSSKLAVDLKGE